MRRILGVAVLCLMAAAGAAAQDEEPAPKWALESELSGLWNSGNSESNSWGLLADLKRLWPNSTLQFRADAARTESALITRYATGTADQFVVEQDEVREKTAELFHALTRYDQNISETAYVLGGVDWMRNVFAGIDSRTLLALGAGNAWVNTERTVFKTDAAFTYTFQSDVIENPFVSHNFPGLRIGYDLKHALTGSTTFESILIGDWNVRDTDDVRANWYNALPVAISETFYLKPFYRVLWRNTPSLTSVELYDSNDVPTGESVLVPLKKVDTVFGISLLTKL